MSAEQPLPRSWTETTLDSLLHRIEAGLNVKCEERPPNLGEKGLVKISAVTWGQFDELQSKTLPASETPVPSNRIQPGDLLISRANTIELVGSSVIVKELQRELYLSDKVLRLVVHEPSKRWINYALKTPALRKAIEDGSSGNQLSMRNISQEKLKALPLPLAPEAEQKRIADKLDTVLTRVDAVNTRLARVAPLLKRFRQSVLAAATSGRLTEDWRQQNSFTVDVDAIAKRRLVDFESNSALRKQWRNREPDNLQLSGADQYNQTQTPSTWLWITLKSVATLDKFAIVDGPFGSDLKSSDYVQDGKYPVLTISMMYDMKDMSAARYVSTEKFEQLTRSKVEGGDILVAKIGSTYGLACLYPPNAPTALIPANMCKITCDNSVALTQYTLLWLKSTVFKAHLDGIVSFSAQPAFNVGNFKSLPIPLPPLIEQTEIVRRVETLFAFADRLEARLAQAQTAATRLTPALLAKAFRGELVPQDPNDEPAAELLRRLQAERASAPKASAGRGRKAAVRSEG